MGNQRHVVVLRKPNQETIFANIRRVSGALFDVAIGRITDQHPDDMAPPFAIARCMRISAERLGELVTMGLRASSAVPVQPAGFTMAPLPPPFLNALADSLLGPPQFESRYVYAGRLYRLRLHKTADPKATEYFLQRKLIAPGAKVIRAAGTVWREAGGKDSQFGIWVEDGNRRPIPLRIEYQAKSYLRLTFEAES